MSTTSSTTSDATREDAQVFDDLARALQDSGPRALLDRLVERLDQDDDFRSLLDALLLRARHDLGLPLIQTGPLSELPEELRSRYEERYIEAIRLVGGKLLAKGEIAAAWPYFRAIGEHEPVARAIDAFESAENDDRLNQVVDVAFNQGANPRKGFELILAHYGTCSAISAFEHLPHDEATRVACAGKLVRQLHEHLAENLRAEIGQRGQPVPPETTPVAALVAGRDWLFGDEAYHIDISHLSSTVRLSSMLVDTKDIALALGLCEYGRRLSPRHQYEGEPPFERIYDDHAVYLRAMLGQEVDDGIAYFRAKLESPEPERPVGSLPAQVLVGLLVRLDRLEPAIAVAAEYLAGLPESTLMCPGVAQLCQRAGQPGRLASIAREQGDLVNYAAAILQSGPQQPGPRQGAN